MKAGLLSKIEMMDREELYKAIYTDSLTSTLNRRALQEQSYLHIAFIDLDSLKWINDNIDHAEGNSLLIELSTKLKEEFGEDNVYRLGGDEFAITCNQEGCKFGLNVRLRNLRLNYPKFSYGIGSSLKEADNNLNLDKFRREQSGERAQRGDCPPWFSLRGACPPWFSLRGAS